MLTLSIISSYVLSLGSLGAYNILYERKKRRLGYVNLKNSLMFNNFFREGKWSVLFWAVTMIPFVNLVWLGPLVSFEKSSDNDITKESVTSDDIKPIELVKNLLDLSEEKDEKLALRVLKTRKAQMKYEEYLSKKKRKYEEVRAEIEGTYRDPALPEKVVAVRRLQDKSSAICQVRTFREYTPDEKIALLLAELEEAYQEKARLEGTDVEEEIKLLLGGEQSKN